MSAFDQAACIIAETGCFADLSIANDEEFDREDRAGRLRAAAQVLFDWAHEAYPDETNEDALWRIAGAMARGMMAQFDALVAKGRAA